MSALQGLAARFLGRGAPAPVGPIGLDLAQEKLHMVQLEERAGELAVRARLSIPYPDGRDALIAAPRRFSAFVRQALKGAPFSGRRVVTCLPAGACRIMNLSYQAPAGQTAEDVIVTEVMHRLGGKADDLVIDYLPIRSRGKGSTEHTVLAAVARRGEVTSYLDTLHRAGLEVDALDIGPAALRRLVASLDRDNNHPSVLLVNFGRDRSFLTVIAGKRLIMDRELTFGEKNLAEQLGQRLNMEEDEALRLLYRYGLARVGAEAQGDSTDLSDEDIVRSIAEILKPQFLEFTDEVHKALIYTASETRGESVERVELLGSVADYPGAARFLGEMFSIPVRVMNPLDLFARSSSPANRQDTESPVRLALATGLALRGFSAYE